MGKIYSLVIILFCAMLSLPSNAGEISFAPYVAIAIGSYSEVVAIGALKFNDLKREAKGDINFDWDEILNLKGDSGPYLQYSYVRAKSILEKARKEGVEANINLKNNPIFLNSTGL
jgi:arginyl-tRNA synthetase